MTHTDFAPTSTEITPPNEVIEAYTINQDQLRVLGGGLVNLSYKAQDPFGDIALQRLHPDMPDKAFDDYEVVTEHLHAYGWPSPRLRKTTDGRPFVRDESGHVWRCTEFLESDGQPPTSPNNYIAGRMGGLLAMWHQDISMLDYEPQHGIPNFHDTVYHLNRLRNNHPCLPSDVCKRLAEVAIDAHDNLDTPNELPDQILHGDPKLANMLFDGGNPFTFIDFDTVMRGAAWLDIGDMVRSTVKTRLSSGDGEAAEVTAAIANRYYDIAHPPMNRQEFLDGTILASQRIALELLARYLNDTVDADYFAWDNERFSDRTENHHASAALQWRVYKSLSQKAA